MIILIPQRTYDRNVNIFLSHNELNEWKLYHCLIIKMTSMMSSQNPLQWRSYYLTKFVVVLSSSFVIFIISFFKTYNFVWGWIIEIKYICISRLQRNKKDSGCAECHSNFWVIMQKTKSENCKDFKTNFYVWPQSSSHGKIYTMKISN